MKVTVYALLMACTSLGGFGQIFKKDGVVYSLKKWILEVVKPFFFLEMQGIHTYKD